MTYTVTPRFFFTDEDMENIMVTALEGGIGYWACLDNEETESPKWGDWSKQPKDMPTAIYAWHILRDGGTLHFLDEEDESAEYFLDLDSLLRGITIAIENGELDQGLDSLDADVADHVIQYGIFGDVEFG